jgi:hypothetical protein
MDSFAIYHPCKDCPLFTAQCMQENSVLGEYGLDQWQGRPPPVPPFHPQPIPKVPIEAFQI